MLLMLRLNMYALRAFELTFEIIYDFPLGCKVIADAVVVFEVDAEWMLIGCFKSKEMRICRDLRDVWRCSLRAINASRTKTTFGSPEPSNDTCLLHSFNLETFVSDLYRMGIDGQASEVPEASPFFSASLLSF